MLGALVLVMSTLVPTGQPGPMQPSDYTPAGPAQVVSWQLKRLPPPSALYVNVDDQLVVGAATSQTGEVVTVNYRLLRAADGKIVPGQFTVAPPNTRAIKVQTQQLAEGFLLSVSVKAAVAITRGQTFVRAFLGAGPFGAGEPSYMLMADYVTTAMAPAHPNGRVLAPSEGPGNIRLVDVANPGAGNDWALVVPTNARWRVLSERANFNTSAAGSTRLVALHILPTNLNVAWNPTWGQAVSQNTRVLATPGLTFSFAAAGLANQNNAMLPLPDGLIILAGGALQSNTFNIDIGDTWVNVEVLVEEWLDNV